MKWMTTIVLLLAFGTASADKLPHWACKGENGGPDVLWVTIIFEPVAQINTETEIWPADYKPMGLRKRFNFGLGEDDIYDYSLVIEPDGTALYYDFSSVPSGEQASPSLRFNCTYKEGES